jgi:plastocyanin
MLSASVIAGVLRPEDVRFHGVHLMTKAAPIVRTITAAAACALLAACSSSQHAGAGMTATQADGKVTVPVELDDYVIRMPDHIPPGDVTFNVKNTGKHVHNIRITGSGVDAALPRNLEAGEEMPLTLHMNPGTYHVTCPVGPHAAMGMRMDLTVQDGE